MEIIIRDEQGLGTALMMDGYSQKQIINAKDAIRQQFTVTATKVFQNVFEMPLPDTIEVNLSQSNKDELEGKSAATLASFNTELSQIGKLYFTIHEISIKNILDQGVNTLFESTVLHEMFHAADLFILKNELQLFELLRKRIYNCYINNNRYDKPIALMDTLAMFNHYRDEGIAVLGESLLMKEPIKLRENPISRFKKNFRKTMEKSSERAGGQEEREENDNDSSIIRHNAYKDAPFVLLFVLYKLGFIEYSLAKKATISIGGKQFNISDEEVKTIMRPTLGLSLASYIQGLMLLGKNVAPIMPFLLFCGKLQYELELMNPAQSKVENDNATAFSQLVQQPASADIFKSAMNQIMGYNTPIEELDNLYMNFINNPIDDPLYSKQKEKVSTLYSILKNEENSDKQLIAQWALTYFFDDQDVIHDDIIGIGFVDDIIVLDYAIGLLKP